MFASLFVRELQLLSLPIASCLAAEHKPHKGPGDSSFDAAQYLLNDASHKAGNARLMRVSARALWPGDVAFLLIHLLDKHSTASLHIQLFQLIQKRKQTNATVIYYYFIFCPFSNLFLSLSSIFKNTDTQFEKCHKVTHTPWKPPEINIMSCLPLGECSGQLTTAYENAQLSREKNLHEGAASTLCAMHDLHMPARAPSMSTCVRKGSTDQQHFGRYVWVCVFYTVYLCLCICEHVCCTLLCMLTWDTKRKQKTSKKSLFPWWLNNLFEAASLTLWGVWGAHIRLRILLQQHEEIWTQNMLLVAWQAFVK